MVECSYPCSSHVKTVFVTNISPRCLSSTSACSASLLLKRLYTSVDRNTLVQYPKPKITRKSSFSKESSRFIPGGAKVTSNDPREKKTKDIVIKVPKFTGRRYSTGDLLDERGAAGFDSFHRPSKKTFESIQVELNTRKNESKTYRPPVQNAFTCELEKQKLQYINTFNGGKGKIVIHLQPSTPLTIFMKTFFASVKGLPQEMTFGIGKSGTESIPLRLVHPQVKPFKGKVNKEDAHQNSRDQLQEDNDEEKLLPRSFIEEERKFQAECRQLYDKISHEIDEKESLLHDGLTKRETVFIEREIKERFDELQRLEKMMIK